MLEMNVVPARCGASARCMTRILSVIKAFPPVWPNFEYGNTVFALTTSTFEESISRT